jgi:GT2 family glycosyltransferase
MQDGAVQIIHVDLDSPAAPMPAADPRARDALVVYWSGERPVAQRMIAMADWPSGPGPAMPLPPRFEPAARERSGCVAPRVSIIVCTRDRPEELVRCLASFRTQTRRPDEVIVVDNASTDERTREAAVAAGVLYVRENRPGLDFARNAGIRRSTGNIIVYTDDDVILHPRWLERITAAFDEPGVLAVTGLVLPAELRTPAQQLFERLWGFGRGFDRIDFGHEFYERTRSRGCPAWEIGAGANMAFRREAFERVGLFDERLGAGAAGCSDDSEMWYRLLAAGWTCRYEPSAVVFHYHRSSLEGLARQIRAYMRGHVAALLIQYERSGERGNLRRAFLSLPRYYLRLLAGRLRGGAAPHNLMLAQEIAGLLEGFAYYFRHDRCPVELLEPAGAAELHLS